MAIALRIRRRLWVALAAIAAALPGMAGAAEARCEAMPAGCTACDCCEKTSPPTTNLDPTQAPIVAQEAPARGMPVGCPASTPCVCRAQEPSAPAHKPGQREEERRVETSRDVAASPSDHPGPRAPAAIAFLPDAGPPRSPTYLRTMRLRI